MHGAGLVGGAGRALALASARTGAREKVQGRSPRGFVARRNSNGLFSQIGKFFPIAPVDFQSIGGGEGGGFGTFFGFFFFREFGGAGRGEGDPETRGTSCAIPSWNVPKSIFRSRSRRKSVTKCDRSMKKCHQIFIYLN